MSLLEQTRSEDVALIDADSGQTVSYGEMLASADDISARLGTRKSLVFVLARNDLCTVHAYAAALRGQHAIVFLDGSRSVSDYAELISAYQPAWLVGPAGSTAALEDLELPTASTASVFDGELITLVPTAPPVLHPDLAVLLSTSGTTGSCRYVRLSRSNVDSNAQAIAGYLELTPAERAVTSLPLHYSFGLSVLHSHWAAGASVVLTDSSVMEDSFWQAVERYDCTSLAGVPFTYTQLERIGYRDMRLPTVRTMQQAGGALDRRLTALYAEHMSAKHGRLFVMYGQTEAAPRMAYVPPDRLPQKLGSAGIAIPGGRFRIEAQHGGDRLDQPGADEVGEIVYEGPSVMMGYATDGADLRDGEQLGGELHTGDIGYLDADDYLFVVGRSKRMAKVYGVRLSLDELEVSLCQHGPAAVIGQQDAIVGFCAFGTDASLEALRREVAGAAHIHHRAVSLRRVDEIPVAASGKTDYRRLEAWAAERR